MTNSPRQDDDEARDADRRGERDEKRREGDRSLSNRPIDPNSLPAKVKIPPGVDAEDVADPGRQTPGAPPVDNRS